jgi:hypothetical protein
MRTRRRTRDLSGAIGIGGSDDGADDAQDVLTAMQQLGDRLSRVEPGHRPRSPWCRSPGNRLLRARWASCRRVSSISSNPINNFANENRDMNLPPMTTPGFTDAAPAALTALIGSLPATPAALQAAAAAAKTASASRKLNAPPRPAVGA